MEKEIKDLLEDIYSLLNHFKKYDTSLDEFRKRNFQASCDKYGNGFNKDGRFAACGTHQIHFDTWKGYFGDSSCAPMLEIRNEKLFWKYFDEYVNARKVDIFSYIADGFKSELSHYHDAIVKERIALDNAINIIEQINNKKEE